MRYVLYTSGSTGRPKAAVVEHQGMLNHLWAKVDDLGLTADDRLAQTAPLRFDVSVRQMLAPLLVGGRVQIFSDEQAQDGMLLLEAVRRSGTTVLETVPTLIRFLLDAQQSAGIRPGAPRWMIATGEELPPAPARRAGPSPQSRSRPSRAAAQHAGDDRASRAPDRADQASGQFMSVRGSEEAGCTDA